MQYKTADRLEIGDVVVIASSGSNYGKRGTVSEIKRYDCGKVCRIYLTPIDCEFTFDFIYSANCRNKDGLIGYHPYYLSLPNRPLNKKY